jgi:hypothetical protein
VALRGFTAAQVHSHRIVLPPGGGIVTGVPSITLSEDRGRRMTPKYARLASWSVRAAVGAGAAGVLADLAGARSLLVTVLVLVFIAVAPAAAIAGLLRGFDVFARLVIAYVTAIAVITFIAMIMLAAGIWSPRGGLVAVALISGACLLPRRMGLITTKVAEGTTKIAKRARTVRMTLADYWVVAGEERTAAQAAEPAPPMTEADSAAGLAPPVTEEDSAAGPAPAMTDADSAVERDRAAGGQHGLAPDVAIEPRARGADAVAGKPSSVRDNA